MKAVKVVKPSLKQQQVAPRWLTSEDVAALLDVSPRTVEQWRLLGSGPPYHKFANGRVGYRKAEVLAWAKPKRVEPRK